MIEIVLLSLILGVVYLILRIRSSRGGVSVRAAVPAPPAQPEPPKQRSTFSRTPTRGSQRHKEVPKASDKRPQRERVLDLHLRGAIFVVSDLGQIDGYDFVTLGPVRVDAGPMLEARIARAAGQKYPKANAVIHLREESRAGQKGKKLLEWRAEAVVATPRDLGLLPPAYQNKVVLIDGSNVINWAVDAGLAQKPSLAPLTSVLKMLQARGQKAGVVFDATIGYRLNDRFMGRDELASLLPQAEDVLVVDKGTIADTILIEMARTDAMIILSNDHFREHPLARHLLKQKGYATAQGITLLDPRA
jgi:hypothetical protein